MKIRCIAIDDEPLALNKLKRNILKFPYLELVAACHNAEQAKRILQTMEVDLIYIDINMPDVNGLEFIRTLENPPMVIFVTAYSEYAVESYKVSALDYLLKPYGTDDFYRTAEKAYRQWMLVNSGKDGNQENAGKGVIYLKSDYKYIRVVCDDILYIEGQNEYLKVHSRTADPFLTHMTFRQILELLPDHFLQIHRSYIANMDHVASAERSAVVMDNGKSLPVSESRRPELLEYFKKQR